MAVSRCIKCLSTRFEMVPANIPNYRFNLYFIQCASCGSVIAIHEQQNIGAMISRLAEKLGVSLD